MNGRIAKFLLCILCGAVLLLAGCTTTAPPQAGTPAPTQAPVAGQAATSVTDLGGVTDLLRNIDTQLSTIAANTRPTVSGGTVTGNIVLFDDQGNAANSVATGTSLVTLPTGKCDVAIFSRTAVGLYVTLEEEKNMDRGGGPDRRYYRNRQTPCYNYPMCRATVQLDDDYPFLYIEYRAYSPGDTLNRVTLSYRCK